MSSPAPIFLRRTDEPTVRLVFALGLAALVHAVLAGGLAIATALGWLAGTRIPKPPEDVALVSVPEAQWNANRALQPPAPRIEDNSRAVKSIREQLPHGQVVDVAGGNDQRPDDAAYLAEHDNRVAKQTRSREQTQHYRQAMATRTSAKPAPDSKADPGAPNGQHGNGGTADDASALHPGSQARHQELTGERKSKVVAMAETDPHGEIRSTSVTNKPAGNSARLLVSPGELANLADDDPESLGHAGLPGDESAPSAGDPAQQSGAPSNDRLDLPEGDATWLNTREFRYAQFFNRIKERVSEQWDVDAAMRKRGQVAPLQAETILAITLDTDGRVVGASVMRASGLQQLDEEAVAAFERAQPFPNPPQALFDSDGKLRFLFGFYVEPAQRTGGFRVFRTRD